MRRRSDSFVNCNQIVRLATLSDTEREMIVTLMRLEGGPYEIVEGGHTDYVGTWSASSLQHRVGVDIIPQDTFTAG